MLERASRDLNTETLQVPAILPEVQAHIVALDGMRGLAILLVLVFHYVNLFFQAGDSTLTKLLFSAASAGWIGVDLFFVLSGFLITGILRQSRSKQHYFRNFMVRRALRIFPLYYASLTVLFLLMPSYPDQAWYWTYLWNVRLGLDGWSHGGKLTHFWSLAVEEQFYLLWPLAVYLLSETGLWRFCLALLGVGLAARIACFAAGFPAAAYTLMPCHVDALAAGAALTFLPKIFSPEQRRRLQVGAVLLTVVILTLFLKDRGFYNTDFMTVTIGISCVNLVFAAILALISRPASPRLTKVFCSRWLVWLGTYSYGIYIVHYPLACWLRDSWQKGAGQGTDASVIAALCVATTVGTFAVAWLSWHLFESRLLRLKKYFNTR